MRCDASWRWWVPGCLRCRARRDEAWAGVEGLCRACTVSAEVRVSAHRWAARVDEARRLFDTKPWAPALAKRVLERLGAGTADWATAGRLTGERLEALAAGGHASEAERFDMLWLIAARDEHLVRHAAWRAYKAGEGTRGALAGSDEDGSVAEDRGGPAHPEPEGVERPPRAAGRRHGARGGRRSGPSGGG